MKRKSLSEIITQKSVLSFHCKTSAHLKREEGEITVYEKFMKKQYLYST